MLIVFVVFSYRWAGLFLAALADQSMLALATREGGRKMKGLCARPRNEPDIYAWDKGRIYS